MKERGIHEPGIHWLVDRPTVRLTFQRAGDMLETGFNHQNNTAQLLTTTEICYDFPNQNPSVEKSECLSPWSDISQISDLEVSQIPWEFLEAVREGTS